MKRACIGGTRNSEVVLDLRGKRVRHVLSRAYDTNTPWQERFLRSSTQFAHGAREHLLNGEINIGVLLIHPQGTPEALVPPTGSPGGLAWPARFWQQGNASVF